MITTVSDSNTPSAASAGELRAALAERLRNDTVHTSAVEAAFRSVPRHLFLPGVPLEAAYADEPVYTKHDDSGAWLSAASQPRIVAMMLEQLRIESGHRILEIGAGTGYNAALMAALAGDTGRVTTLDIDQDLIDSARDHLAAAGVGTVQAVLGDGALGYPQAAPYDRVIATVGAFETPTAWLDQLAPGGRLVLPLRLAGAASRSIIFERGNGAWHSHGSQMCTFMPLRGTADDARRTIDLTGTGEVILQAHKDNDHATPADALAGVLAAPRREAWTGVLFAPGETFEWLYLWLACRLDNPIMRMNVERSAKDSSLVSPMFPTVAMATTTADGSLAYLTIRSAEPTPEGTKRYEVGVLSHGPTAQRLADRTARHITTWDTGFRTRPVTFALPDTPAESDPDAGHFLLRRPHHPLTVTWQ